MDFLSCNHDATHVTCQKPKYGKTAHRRFVQSSRPCYQTLQSCCVGRTRLCGGRQAKTKEAKAAKKAKREEKRQKREKGKKGKIKKFGGTGFSLHFLNGVYPSNKAPCRDGQNYQKGRGRVAPKSIGWNSFTFFFCQK